MVDLLINKGRSFIFTTALPEPVAAMALAGVRVARASPELRERLAANTTRLRVGLRELGWAPLGTAHIVPIVVGDRAMPIAALALLGCLPRRAPELPVSGPVALGWRLVPGQELDYRSRLTRATGEMESVRVEQWTYLVRSVDSDGVALLEGRLTGLGAGTRTADRPQQEEALPDRAPIDRERMAGPRTSLRLDRSGRLLELRTGPAFADRVRHYLLALRLPTGAVSVHDEWKSPDLSEFFSTLLPASLGVECNSSVRLAELTHRPAGLLAELATSDRVDIARGPALEIDGHARWDAQLGCLLSRSLTARIARGLPGTLPSTLTLHLERIARRG
jgi:hypothetical protein